MEWRAVVKPTEQKWLLLLLYPNIKQSFFHLPLAPTACTAWLNTNRPSEKNGLKGTADQHLQKLKRAFAFSNINQVIYKYMDDEGNIKLPESTTPTTKPGSGVGGGGEIES